MLLSTLIAELKAGVSKSIQAVWSVDDFEVQVSTPPRPEMGDLALSFAFPLAKVLRRPPPSIAQRVGEHFKHPGVASWNVSGGYLNLSLDLHEVLNRGRGLPLLPHSREGKTLVEHTNINPNKAAHIGHLRNAVLGDSLVRILRALGEDVEVHYYVDDTGVQVADAVVGLTALEGLDLPGVKTLAQTVPLDQFLWDLYAKVSASYQDNPSLQAKRKEVLSHIDDPEHPLGAMALYISSEVFRAHLRTMFRLDVSYDFAPFESDILGQGLWTEARKRLKESGAMILADEGTQAGCWVMPLENDPEFEGLEEPNKILIRSEGTPTYTAKDIAYQMWKVGLLPNRLGAVLFSKSPYPLWRSAPADQQNGPRIFGSACRAINVIDVRQAYPQKVVRGALRRLGAKAEADQSSHFDYEVVSLSPKAAKTLGYEPAAQGGSVDMSGRKGLGVKADTLLDSLTQLATEEAQRRAPEVEPEVCKKRGREMAVAALRYFLLRTQRRKRLVFDFEEALAMEGETGPYLLYSLVRAGKILEKASLTSEEHSPPPQWPRDSGSRSLVLSLLRTGASLVETPRNFELHTPAKNLFLCAQEFHHFYHDHPVLKASTPELKKDRLFTVALFHRWMSHYLSILGLPTPTTM